MSGPYRYHPPTPDPTPAQIRQACREIQSTWSQREFYARAGALYRALTIPVVKVASPGREPK